MRRGASTLAALSVALGLGAALLSGSVSAREAGPKPRTVALLRQYPDHFRASGTFIAWMTADRRGCKIHVLQSTTRRRAVIHAPPFFEACLDDLALSGPRVLWAVAQGGHTERFGIAYSASFGSRRPRKILKIHQECGDCSGIRIVAGEGTLVTVAGGVFRKVVGGQARLLFRLTPTAEDEEAGRAKGPGWRLADLSFYPGSIAGGTLAVLKVRRFENDETEEISWDDTAELRRLADGKLIRTFPLSRRPDAISVSGSLLVSWRCCYVIDLYDIATGKIQRSVPIGSHVQPRATPTGVVFFNRKELRFRRNTGETSVLARATGQPVDLAVTGRRAVWVGQIGERRFPVRSIRLP